MADAVFFPQLAIIIRMHPKLINAFPIMSDYYKRLSPRKSIQDTWPPHWKEVEGQDIFDEKFDPHTFDVTRFFG
jgi:glutathione S-transferase